MARGKKNKRRPPKITSSKQSQELSHGDGGIQKKSSKFFYAIGTNLLAGVILTIIFAYYPFPSQVQDSPITLRSISDSYTTPVSNFIAERIKDALQCRDDGDYATSILHIKSVLESYGKADRSSKHELASIYAFQANCYELLGEINSAINSYNISLAQDEEFFPHYRLSKIYFKELEKVISGDNHDIKMKVERIRLLKLYEYHRDEADKLRNKFSLQGELYETSNETLNAESSSLNISNIKLLTTYNTVYLIAVGVNEYQDVNVNKLNYAENDASDIVDSFRSVYADKLVLATHLGVNATRSDILKSVNDIERKAKDDDLIVFYYAGHGFIDSSTVLKNTAPSKYSGGSRYILPYDADLNSLPKTSLALDEIKSIFNSAKTKASPLIIVDSCYTDNMNALLAQNFWSKLMLNALSKVKDRLLVVSLADNTYISAASMERINDFSKRISGRYDPRSKALVTSIYQDIFSGVRTLKEHGLSRNSDYDLANNVDSHAVLISSTSIGQGSAESSDYKNGVFTHYLSLLLNNLDDSAVNKDVLIELSDLKDSLQASMDSYLYDKDHQQSIAVTR